MTFIFLASKRKACNLAETRNDVIVKMLASCSAFICAATLQDLKIINVPDISGKTIQNKKSAPFQEADFYKNRVS